MSDELSEAVERVRKGVLEAETLEELAKTLFSLQKFRILLSDVIEEAHTALAGRMEHREQDLGPGIGIIRRGRDVKSTWSHHDLLQTLMDETKTVDPETGEVEINGFELASRIEKCVAFAYWRKTALRDLKIDFSEHLSEVYGHPRVRFLSKEGS